MSTRELLDSWKAISTYLGRTARTCQRWEEELNLPVHRLDGSPKSRVFAYKDEIDRWLEKIAGEKGEEKAGFWDRVLPRPRRFAVSAVLTALIVIGVLGWRTLNVGPVRLGYNTRPAVAVLPFVNDTGDRSLDFLGESLPANLIEGLQRSADHITVFTPEVVADSLRKLGVADGIDPTAEELRAFALRTGAGYLVSARIAKSGNKLRVAYELRDAATLETLASGRGADSERNLPGLGEQLRASILSTFGIPAGPARETVLPCSPQANRYYEMARSAERKFVISMARAELDRMTNLFREALAADPSCALAFHGLGDAFQFHYVYEGHAPSMLEAAFENYRKAHDLAPDRAETSLGLGWIQYFQQDNARAYTHFKRAIELDPVNIRVLTDVAVFLNSVGIQERSVEYFSRVIRAGDTSAGTYVLRAAAYEDMGLYEGALADYDRVIKMDPNDGATRCRRARVLILMRRFTEADEELDVARTLNPPESYAQIVRALLHAARGEKKAALAAIAPFRPRPARYYNYLTRVYAALGMKDEAIETIEQAIAGSFAETQEYAFFFPFLNNNRDHFFDKLRGDRRFAEILKREERKHLANLEAFVGL